MKIMYYLETIAVISLKVGLSIQINELMKLNEYQSQGHFKERNFISTCAVFPILIFVSCIYLYMY